jgi:branched-chain amino acid transport system ATP-binding protein
MKTLSNCSVLPHGKKGGLAWLRALLLSKAVAPDEPMTGECPETEEMMKLIRKHQGPEKITTIIIEHNMKVMGLCDRIVVLNNGTTLAVGSPLDVSNNPAVVSAYLGG